jgi:hypothetical protein
LDDRRVFTILSATQRNISLPPGKADAADSREKLDPGKGQRGDAPGTLAKKFAQGGPSDR